MLMVLPKTTAAIAASILRVRIRTASSCKAGIEMTIVGTCGHELNEQDGEDGMGFDVMYQGEDCDALTGFYRTVSYASVCGKCLKQYQDLGITFKTEAESNAWLDADHAIDKHDLTRQGSNK